MRRKNTSSETMKQYIAEALLLLMERKSYHEIQIGEITNRAGVHRSTYYRNFNSKEDIIRHFYQQILEESRQHNSFQILELKEYLLKVFEHYYTYKNELILLHKAGLSYLMLDSLNETFKSVYSGNAQVDMFFVYYHTGGIYNNYILWFSNEMAETPEEITNIICDFFPENFQPMLTTLKKNDLYKSI